MTAQSILFLTRRLDIGGAQRQLVELASGLQREGWNVEVATFYEGGALEQPLRARGVKTVCINKRGRWDVLQFLWRTSTLIRQRRPDIVHGYLDMANIVLALLRPWVRPARIIWGVRASGMNLSHYDRLARVEANLARLLSYFAELIICNSEAGRAYHAARGYPEARMAVIPNGIDTRQFRPDSDARHSVRAAWGVSADERVIGVVARLDPMKDHANFLRAAAYVRESEPNVRFVCVGGGPATYLASLSMLARELELAGHVIWENPRGDVWRVYSALDVACSPSAYGEGFSNAVGEAMACGVPCVVTDVGDSAAIVGDVGWVCPANDSNALGEALLKALRTLPADPDRIRQRIHEHFSTSALVKRTQEELTRLMARGAKRVGGRGSHSEMEHAGRVARCNRETGS